VIGLPPMKSGRIHVFVALLLFEPCLAAWSPSQEARLVWLSADEIARGEEKAQTCFDQGKIPWSQAQESQRLAELPAHYKYWLTEDAGEIISPEERCAFLLLGDDQEREQFIEQFWIRRAPNPQSFENSFKVEHYRRIVEADRRSGANGPGWETDRGKYYIRDSTPDNQRLDLWSERVQKTDKSNFT
jgi:GWxTD domain-containing protein